MAPVGVVGRRMDVEPDKDQLGIQAWKEADADAADHSEVTPVGSAGQPEVWSDRQLRPALEILAGRRVEALSTWRADAIGTVPTITGIVFAPSGTASQFTSGLSRSRVESGVTSTPACSRGVNLQVSVECTRARPAAPGIAPALNANRFWPMASAPPTSRHSPSHSGQKGTREAPSKPTPPWAWTLSSAWLRTAPSEEPPISGRGLTERSGPEPREPESR